MKKNTLFLLVWFTMSGLGVYAQNCYYASRTVSGYISKAFTELGIQERSTFSYGTLYQGQNSVFSKTFYRSNTYVLGVAGDDDAKDIDIYVYDQNGNLVAKNNANDQVAVVKFYARYTGIYYIKVVMYATSSRGRPGCWALNYGWEH